MIEFFVGVGTTLVVEYLVASGALWLKARKVVKEVAPSLDSILDATDGWKKIPEKVGQAVEAVQDKVQDAKELVEDSVEKVNSAKNFVQDSVEKVKDLRDSAQEFVQDVVDEVDEKVEYGAQYVKETFDDVKGKFIGKTDEPQSSNSSPPPVEKV